MQFMARLGYFFNIHKCLFRLIWWINWYLSLLMSWNKDHLGVKIRWTILYLYLMKKMMVSNIQKEISSWLNHVFQIEINFSSFLVLFEFWPSKTLLVRNKVLTYSYVQNYYSALLKYSYLSSKITFIYEYECMYICLF